MSQQGKYAVHVVEMVRNNGISDEMNETSDCFFMFDYFDVLYHKELKDKDKRYENYLCIKDFFEDYQKYKVSYKALSLYQEYGRQQQNPFKIEASERGLSDAPFIGLIQITLCKENFRDRGKALDVEAFLRGCEDYILGVAGRLWEGKGYAIKASQLYRSSTTGDFCLVMRTDSVEAIYQTAAELGDMYGGTPGDGLPRLFTYTNIGMECRAQNGKFCTLGSDFVEEHSDLTIALRLSATTQFGEQLARYARQRDGEAAGIETVKGLFGRYDYLLNVSMEEFAEIYPVLCRKKLGAAKPVDQNAGSLDGGKTGAGSGTGAANGEGAVLRLSDIIENNFTQSINERILINCSVSALKEEAPDWQAGKERQQIIEKNNATYGKVKALSRWEKYYAGEYREFQELLRCMKEMCRTFLPAGMEQDAYLNWLTFSKDMSVLCGCVNREMENYEKMEADCSEEELKKYRIGILSDWRANIQAINQYTKLVQHVNYQTYQSPVYEIQTQIDTEKAMVAYREAMENYLYLYQENMGQNGDKRDCIRALIYPELSRSDVIVGAPFVLRMEGDRINREIFCTVPSFEYFGRVYDLLPWLLHECSHQIRILPRSERNDFVVRSILKDVFKNIAQHAFSSSANDLLYVQSGKAERILRDAMAEAAYGEIFSDGWTKEMGRFPKSSTEKVQESGFEEMIFRVQNYLSMLFEHKYAYLEEKDAKWESHEDIRARVTQELQDAVRSQGLAKEYLDCMKETQKNGSDLKQLQNIAALLLASYWAQLQECLQDVEKGFTLCEEDPVSLKELTVHISELDRRLADKMERIESRLKIKENPSVQAEAREALRHYCFSVKKLCRVYKKYTYMLKQPAKKEYADSFLLKVFQCYQKKISGEGRKEFGLCADPPIYFVLRQLGLLNGDKKLFCKQMKRFMWEKDISEIRKIMDFRVKQYRESVADILMAISLRLGSFGYCRQFFQTISDTKLDKKEELYGSVNMERCRLVTAVLLAAEGAQKQASELDSEEVRIDGEELLEQSRKYCEFTIKCIQKEFLQNQKLEDSEERLLGELLDIMQKQLAEYLGNMSRESYKCTVLYLMLHKADSENGKKLKLILKERYGSIEGYLLKIHYQFFRLEHLCLGLQKIFTGKCIVVSRERFEYLSKVWQEASGKAAAGCKWEEGMAEGLAAPKRNVGIFYNDPQQVFTLDRGSKLDNTIDFIQNYYYHNRFRVMDMENGGLA